MTFAITIFFLSFAGIAFLLVNKSRELAGKKAFVTVSHETNHKIKSVTDKVTVSIKKSPQVVWKTLLFVVIKVSILVFEKAKTKFYPKIAHLVDSVKGRHVPKNKGSASFFLTNIKEHKEAGKKFEI